MNQIHSDKECLMFKKFISGLVFGAGFGIAFLLVGITGVYFVLPVVVNNNPQMVSSKTSLEQNAIDSLGPPSSQYLGSTGTHSTGFKHEGSLSPGDSEIIGNVSANGEPVSGLKLRLALNGRAYSQWVLSKQSGQYVIKVPPGKYRIDGYEIEKNTADSLLAGLILHPQAQYSTATFPVTEGSPGRGIAFKFVSPITKEFNKKYSLKEDIILDWDDYPDASKYLLQITEKDEPYGWSNNRLFDWHERPELVESTINLTEYGIDLNAGKFYTVHISARNQEDKIISETARLYNNYDFEITN